MEAPQGTLLPEDVLIKEQPPPIIIGPDTMLQQQAKRLAKQGSVKEEQKEPKRTRQRGRPQVM